MGGEDWGVLRWEESIRRYNALAEACEDANGHRKWWLHSEKPDGPSKWCGVRFKKPSWAANITIGGAYLHVATCECEDDAAIVADLALVADGREPKNFPEFWDSIKARVEASENGDVPAAVAPVVFRGSVRVDGVTIGVSEAASALEAKIKAAVAEKPEVAEESVAMVLDAAPVAVAAPEAAPPLEAKIKAAIAEKPEIAAESLDPEAFWRRPVELKPDQLGRLKNAGITTVGGLALASVDEEKHVRAVTSSKDVTSTQSRRVLWSKKSAAAERLDVDIGALPAKQKAAKTSTKERPLEHQRVPDGVANCSIRCFSG